MRNQALKLFPFDRLPTKVAAPFRLNGARQSRSSYAVVVVAAAAIERSRWSRCWRPWPVSLNTRFQRDLDMGSLRRALHSIRRRRFLGRLARHLLKSLQETPGR
jgi:hypothetical protein